MNAASVFRSKTNVGWAFIVLGAVTMISECAIAVSSRADGFVSSWGHSEGSVLIGVFGGLLTGMIEMIHGAAILRGSEVRLHIICEILTVGALSIVVSGIFDTIMILMNGWNLGDGAVSMAMAAAAGLAALWLSRRIAASSPSRGNTMLWYAVMLLLAASLIYVLYSIGHAVWETDVLETMDSICLAIVYGFMFLAMSDPGIRGKMTVTKAS